MFERLKSLIGGANIAGATAAPKPVTDTLILEILDGKWGSGDARKTKLTKAGYNYDAVQKRINEVMAKMKTRKQAMKPWFDACKEQEQWSYNARYNWGKWSPRTVAKSKDYGTCITYPNSVAMRCKLIKEPAQHVLTSTGSDHDSKKTQDEFWNASVKTMNSINGKYWSSIKYPNKDTKTLVKEGKIKEGDIIGFMGHTSMYAGKDKNGTLLFNNAGHAAGISGDKPGSNRAVLNQKSSYMTNRKVYGIFSVNTFIVITNCTDGTITPCDRYMAGQDVKITIKPKAGMVVKSIKVDGKKVSASNTYTIKKIDSHHIIDVVCGTETKKKYTGPIPTLRLKKTNAEAIADTIKWAKWIAGDNRFHYGYTSPDGKISAYHNGCYFCGTQKTSGARSKKGIVDYQFSYCCNPFVGAAWAHGGCVPKAISLCQSGSSWGFAKSEGYEKSSLFDKLGKPATSKLKPGDVLCSDSHVALYIGDGKVVQAGHIDDNVRNSKKWNSSISIGTWNGWTRAYRFNGKVDADIIMRHGEVSKRVAEWQAFLDWYFDGKVGSADGYFGDNTLKWTKEFQEKEIGKGEGDGLCGNKTFTAAANVRK